MGWTDLHRHLDGSLRPETYLELAEACGLGKDDGPPMFYAGMGLEAALACFAQTLAVLQTSDAVERVASEVVEDAQADGVRTLEVRFAPQLHAPPSRRRRELQRVVDSALSGLGGRAGLILCTLYGEPPELAELLVDVALDTLGVVGVDLAGGPAPGHRYAMMDYSPAFLRASRRGLGVTVHAGEGRPPQEIAVAVEHLGAHRIGHGTTLLRDPEVSRLVLDRGVTLEACLTSNVHVGAIGRVEDHELVGWLSMGHKVVICTDNTLLSNVTASEEWRRAEGLPGMTGAMFQTLVESAPASAFARD